MLSECKYSEGFYFYLIYHWIATIGTLSKKAYFLYIKYVMSELYESYSKQQKFDLF